MMVTALPAPKFSFRDKFLWMGRIVDETRKSTSLPHVPSIDVYIICGGEQSVWGRDDAQKLQRQLSVFRFLPVVEIVNELFFLTLHLVTSVIKSSLPVFASICQEILVWRGRQDHYPLTTGACAIHSVLHFSSYVCVCDIWFHRQSRG
jgi:hypothetical protein